MFLKYFFLNSLNFYEIFRKNFSKIYIKLIQIVLEKVPLGRMLQRQMYFGNIKITQLSNFYEKKNFFIYIVPSQISQFL